MSPRIPDPPGSHRASKLPFFARAANRAGLIFSVWRLALSRRVTVTISLKMFVRSSLEMALAEGEPAVNFGNNAKKAHRRATLFLRLKTKSQIMATCAGASRCSSDNETTANIHAICDLPDLLALRRLSDLVDRQEKTEIDSDPIRVANALKQALALVNLNLALQQTAGVDLAVLLDTYTPSEIADSLKLINLTKEYACGYAEVAAALRLRQMRITQQARYNEKHRAEINKKNAANRLAKRQIQTAKNSTGGAVGGDES